MFGLEDLPGQNEGRDQAGENRDEQGQALLPLADAGDQLIVGGKITEIGEDVVAGGRLGGVGNHMGSECTKSGPSGKGLVSDGSILSSTEVHVLPRTLYLVEKAH